MSNELNMKNKNIRVSKFVSDKEFKMLDLLCYRPPKVAKFGWSNEYRKISDDVVVLRMIKGWLVVDALIDHSDLELVSKKRWIPEFKPNIIYVKSGDDNPVALHRYVLGLAKMDETVDHINNNGRDNRKANLEKVKNKINERKRLISTKNTTGIMGLMWEGPANENQTGRWRIRLIDENDKIVIKNFRVSKFGNDVQAAKEAAIAELKANREAHPHFSYSVAGDRERIQNMTAWEILDIPSVLDKDKHVKKESVKHMGTYNASQIVALDQMTAIRQKLGMYIGSTATPNQIVVELLSNAIDEVAGGYGNSVEVTLEKDGSVIVEDHGRGIPYDYHSKLKMSALDVVFMKTHAGGKMGQDDSGYKTSIGTHGVGCTVATATCEKMIVDVWRSWEQATRIYSRGKTVGDLKVKQYVTEKKTGTRIQYYPDPTPGLWGTVVFDKNAIKTMMRGFAYFYPMATLNYIDRTGDKEEKISFNYPDGLLSMYNDMAGKEDLLTKEPMRLKVDLYGIEDALEIVFGYTNGFYERTVGYCNSLRLAEGGTHVQGFKRALTKSLNDAARTLQLLKPKDQNFKGQELSEGLVSIVSVKLRDPKFENQTKTKLSNLELEGDTYSKVYDYLKNYFEDNPKVVTSITEKLIKMRKAREAAKKAKDAVLGNKKSGESFALNLNSKFAACSERNPEKCELFLCEGSSAIGGLKQARDSKTQALYALRGKIRNVEKVDLATVFQNQEIKDIIQILGCGINEEYDESKLKYHKVIIACDSDVD